MHRLRKAIVRRRRNTQAGEEIAKVIRSPSRPVPRSSEPGVTKEDGRGDSSR